MPGPRFAIQHGGSRTSGHAAVGAERSAEAVEAARVYALTPEQREAESNARKAVMWARRGVEFHRTDRAAVSRRAVHIPGGCHGLPRQGSEGNGANMPSARLRDG
jgi:hypothetical protein